VKAYVTRNARIRGGEPVQLAGSLPDCWKACLSQAACHGFDFNSSNDTKCFLHGQQSICNDHEQLPGSDNYRFLVCGALRRNYLEFQFISLLITNKHKYLLLGYFRSLRGQIKSRMIHCVRVNWVRNCKLFSLEYYSRAMFLALFVLLTDLRNIIIWRYLTSILRYVVFCCLAERSNRTTPSNAMSNPQHVGKRVACVRSLFTFLLFNHKISSRYFQYIRTSKSRSWTVFVPQAFLFQYTFSQFLFKLFSTWIGYIHRQNQRQRDLHLLQSFRNCLLHVTKYKLKFTSSSSSNIMYSKRSLTLLVAVVVV